MKKIRKLNHNFNYTHTSLRDNTHSKKCRFVNHKETRSCQTNGGCCDSTYEELHLEKGAVYTNENKMLNRNVNLLDSYL